MISNETKEAILKSALEQQKKRNAEPITGPATSLRCTCGGVLHEREFPAPPHVLTGPRRSKNRRIRKKQLMKWIRTHGRMLNALHIMIQTSRPRGYRCASCKRHIGFYEAVARDSLWHTPRKQLYS